ncbi:MAG: protoglobin domain-containing protein [Psychrosphaera sp.]|nr:protoglobin domain-containing protein [Psychrosphaera sp.]
MKVYTTGSHTVTSDDISRLTKSYGLCSGDQDQIKSLGQQLEGKIDAVIDQFYDWLEAQPEWDIFFSDVSKANKLKKMQAGYWQDFFTGELTIEYIEKRRKIGIIHSQIGLSLAAYFSAMSTFQDLFIKQIDDITQDQMVALNRMILLDAGITVETFNQDNNQTIADQNKAMMEMSTPVTSIWEDIQLLPIVGIIDSSRAQDIMDVMLNRVAEQQTRVFILDISGVAVVDTAVANHIIKMTKASELMGCKCLISGISPSIAQTMVELGIDIGKIKTTSNLKDALKFAFTLTGVIVTKGEGLV